VECLLTYLLLRGISNLTVQHIHAAQTPRSRHSEEEDTDGVDSCSSKLRYSPQAQHGQVAY
jgi:hypothetical protein